MADLSITFTNMSKAAFRRSTYGWEESILDTNAQLPDEIMKSREIQVFGVNNQTPVAEGAANFWCCWLHEATAARFGVKIHEAGQPFGMGWQPTWQVMSDLGTPGQDPHWLANGEDAASPYTWSELVGFKIKASVTASHETLQIAVLILDLSAK
jgi:hypothetical protein